MIQKNTHFISRFFLTPLLLVPLIGVASANADQATPRSVKRCHDGGRSASRQSPTTCAVHRALTSQRKVAVKPVATAASNGPPRIPEECQGCSLIATCYPT